MTRKLTSKQKIFVGAYVKGDVKKASKKAKISYDYARQLLTKPHIIAAIEEKQSKFLTKVERETDITREWLLRQYKKINDFDVRSLYDKNGYLKQVVDLDAATAYAITGIKLGETRTFGDGKDAVTVSTKDIRSIDKKGALDSIGKIIGAFEKDNQQKRPSLEELYAAMAELSPKLADAIKEQLTKNAAG